MRFRDLTRGGRFLRVADPAWRNPLDGRYAERTGARWNPPATFPVVYLCRTVGVARANVVRRFAGLPYGVLDLLAERRPTLVETEVEEHRAVDVVTDGGWRAAGLPATYPREADGSPVPWERCRPIGLVAWKQDESSIACRSAAISPPERGEELAWFVRGRADRLRVVARRPFDEWVDE